MFLDLTPEQLALRAELRAYFAGLMSPAEHAELSANVRDVVGKLAAEVS